jgi:RNA polymerase sigma-70 factor (ECF subfamily)
MLKSKETDLDTILSDARRFDPRALSVLHDLFYPQVFRYVAYRIHETQTCEDISSEVFIRLLDHLKSEKDDIRSLRGWLFGTAAHLVQDHYRKQYRRPVGQLDGNPEVPAYPSVEEELEQSFIFNDVRKALKFLTAEQQHVLALRFSQQLSLLDTAQVMNKSVEAVKVLQYRALAALRRRMKDSR